MSSLQKRVIINTRERAVSDDINQLQAFIAQNHQELLRAMFGERRTAPGRQYPGVTAPYASPLPSNTCPHDVISGLLVRPDLGASLLIDPGTIGYNSPGQGGVDDSNYIITRSDGITSTGVLSFTANGGSDTRIDVVECQPTEVLTQTSSRDIYDPVTGLFTPAIVEKVRESRLTFRIVTGTGGLRNITSSWVPLAVIFVPPGASGFTQCDVFDVRPLLEDRVLNTDNRSPVGGSVVTNTSGNGNQAIIRCMRLGIASQSSNRMYGYYESDFNGFMAGGKIQKNCPTTLANFGTGTDGEEGDDEGFSLTDTLNLLTTVASTTPPQVLPIVALFPGGYPRWVRYTQLAVSSSTSAGLHASGRLPSGSRGILMMGPASLATHNGVVSVAPAAWPTNTGLHLGSTNVGGIVVAHLKQNGTQRLGPVGSLQAGFHFPDWDGEMLTEEGDTSLDATFNPIAGSPIRYSVDIELPQGSKGVPRNATAVLVRFSGAFSAAPPWELQAFTAAVHCSNNTNRSFPVLGGSHGLIESADETSVRINWTGWVPLWKLEHPDAGSATTLTILSLIVNTLSGDLTALNSYVATVSGYRVE